MRATLRKARVIFGVYYAMMIEYRGELFLWAVVMALPLILMGLWTQAATHGEGFALTATQFARYFIAVFVIRQFTVVWVIHEFGWLVNSGRLSPQLLVPLDPGWRFVAAHYGERVARLPMAAGLVGLALLLFPQAVWGAAADAAAAATAGDSGVWWPGWRAILLSWLFMEVAWVARFLLQYTLATAAFWVERVESVDFLIYLPYLFLSGMMAPLDEFPAAVREVALWTPFPYMVWLPAMLVVEPDRFTTGELLRALLVMAGWIAVFYAVNRWAWRRGIRHYSAMGA